MAGRLRKNAVTLAIALVGGMVGANAPAIAHGVHASFAHNAHKVDGIHAASAGAANKIKKLIATDGTGKLPVSVIPKADADTLDGQDSSAFANLAHGHSGADITSGEIDETRIDSEIARDSEITAHNHDGAYSALGHGHAGEEITSGTVAAARIDNAIARDSELPTAGFGLTNSGGAFAVSTNSIQSRINQVCTGNTFMQSIGVNGTAVCTAGNTGDITDVTTAPGSGLSGGTIFGSANLSVDFNTAQRRVQSCSVGFAIRVVDSGGGVTCEPVGTGDITAVNTNPGLLGGAASGAITLTPNFTSAGGENGSATTVARGDHNHDTRYINASPGSPESASIAVNGLIRTTDLIRVGSETGTTDPPNHTGVLVRRIDSHNLSSGSVVARTGDLRIVRNGTPGGFNVASSGDGTLACMGMDADGNSVNRAQFVSSPNTLPIYTNDDLVVYFSCSFGMPTNSAAHETQVTLHRTNPTSPDWVGYITSTFNQ